MFSKLLKYELKSVGKWYFTLNASIIAISIFLGFSIKTLTDYAENYTTSNANHYTQLIPIILSIMFGVVVASAWIATPVSYTHLDVYKRQDTISSFDDFVDVFDTLLVFDFSEQTNVPVTSFFTDCTNFFNVFCSTYE